MLIFCLGSDAGYGDYRTISNCFSKLTPVIGLVWRRQFYGAKVDGLDGRSDDADGMR